MDCNSTRSLAIEGLSAWTSHPKQSPQSFANSQGTGPWEIDWIEAYEARCGQRAGCHWELGAQPRTQTQRLRGRCEAKLTLLRDSSHTAPIVTPGTRTPVSWHRLYGQTTNNSKLQQVTATNKPTHLSSFQGGRLAFGSGAAITKHF